jgi:excinuclease ABC subunit C
MHFGTAKAVRAAGLAQLMDAPGISETVAQKIYDHFHPAG